MVGHQRNKGNYCCKTKIYNSGCKKSTILYSQTTNKTKTMVNEKKLSMVRICNWISANGLKYNFDELKALIQIEFEKYKSEHYNINMPALTWVPM